MKSRRNLLCALVASATYGAAVVGSGSALAASHREAPLIAQMPAVDNTDT